MKKILLIDDCLDMLELNKLLLESEGYDVFVANSGKQGLQLLAEISSFDLILLDFKMPEMDGEEFIAYLSSCRPDLIKTIPIVIMTALDSLPKSVPAQYMSKSQEPDQFLQQIKRILGSEKKRVFHEKSITHF